MSALLLYPSTFIKMTNWKMVTRWWLVHHEALLNIHCKHHDCGKISSAKQCEHGGITSCSVSAICDGKYKFSSKLSSFRFPFHLTNHHKLGKVLLYLAKKLVYLENSISCVFLEQVNAPSDTRSSKISC